jgi:hypothetical protein
LQYYKYLQYTYNKDIFLEKKKIPPHTLVILDPFWKAVVETI